MESALESDPMLKQYDFTVTTSGRTVRIEGAVFSDKEADRAVTVAQRVPGVGKVQSEVQFSATGDSPEALLWPPPEGEANSQRVLANP